MPGGSWYTSAKKAYEYIRLGRAVIEGNMLRFVDRIHTSCKPIEGNPSFWNGSPKPKIMQKISIRTLIQEEMYRGDPMRKPGEVRS